MWFDHPTCWHLLSVGEPRATVSYRGWHWCLAFSRFGIGETGSTCLSAVYPVHSIVRLNMSDLVQLIFFVARESRWLLNDPS